MWITKIESKYELKEIDIKNGVCYYFDDIFNVTDINFSDILLAKKLYENILVYDISHVQNHRVLGSIT